MMISAQGLSLYFGKIVLFFCALFRNKRMTGPQMLIVAVILMFVIAFAITMIVLNAHAKNMISTNKKLVENQNALLEQNTQHKIALEKRIDELEEQLQHHIVDQVTLLQEQTRQHREHFELTANMSDEELMNWIDQEMEEKRLYTDSNLTIKTMAKALGLTQKRLFALFKNNENTVGWATI